MSEVTNNFNIAGNYIAKQYIQTQNITYMGEAKSEDVVAEEPVEDTEVCAEENEDGQSDTGKDVHIRLFREAMLDMQEGFYRKEEPMEGNIKHVYDWYGVFRMAMDIGIVSSFDEFKALMNGDGWKCKPKAIQNFTIHQDAICDTFRFPNWQCKVNAHGKEFHKYLHIANHTYSIYKLKCGKAKVTPFK